MDLKNLATQLLMDQLGSSGKSSIAESAMTALVGKGADFDLGSMVSQFTSGGGAITEMAKSWLGNDKNKEISSGQLQDILGSDKIAAFANQLGLGKEEAGQSLSKIIPQLVDQSSKNGNLLDAIGGSGKLADIASKFFK
jgi:uncharacterized protein YidB (DUF937 family)